MSFFGASKTGPVRKMNQDSFFAQNTAGGVFIAAVCDGMGGAAAGNVASLSAVNTIKQKLCFAFDKAPEDGYDFYGLLRKSFEEADDELMRLVLNNPELSGMGTTAVAAIVWDGRVYVANVGDSRCYRITGSKAVRVTKDHSYVQMLIDNGTISESEAENHPNKNIITKALGGMTHGSPDFFSFKADCPFILCSDGLTNFISEKRIAEIVNSSKSVQLAVNTMTDEAIANGGGDNVTTVLADFR